MKKRRPPPAGGGKGRRHHDDRQQPSPLPSKKKRGTRSSGGGGGGGDGSLLAMFASPAPPSPPSRASAMATSGASSKGLRKNGQKSPSSCCRGRIISSSSSSLNLKKKLKQAPQYPSPSVLETASSPADPPPSPERRKKGEKVPLFSGSGANGRKRKRTTASSSSDSDYDYHDDASSSSGSSTDDRSEEEQKLTSRRNVRERSPGNLREGQKDPLLPLDHRRRNAGTNSSSSTPPDRHPNGDRSSNSRAIQQQSSISANVLVPRRKNGRKGQEGTLRGESGDAGRRDNAEPSPPRKQPALAESPTKKYPDGRGRRRTSTTPSLTGGDGKRHRRPTGKKSPVGLGSASSKTGMNARKKKSRATGSSGRSVLEECGDGSWAVSSGRGVNSGENDDDSSWGASDDGDDEEGDGTEKLNGGGAPRKHRNDERKAAAASGRGRSPAQAKRRGRSPGSKCRSAANHTSAGFDVASAIDESSDAIVERLLLSSTPYHQQFYDDGTGKKPISASTTRFSVGVMREEANSLPNAGALTGAPGPDHSRCRSLFREDGREEEEQDDDFDGAQMQHLERHRKHCRTIISNVLERLRTQPLPAVYIRADDPCNRQLEATTERRRAEVEEQQAALLKLQEQHRRLSKALSDESAKNGQLQLRLEHEQQLKRDYLHFHGLGSALTTSSNGSSICKKTDLPRRTSASNASTNSSAGASRSNNHRNTAKLSYRPAPKGTMKRLLEKMGDV